uniref:Uncharacterized protein n=1 Tax=Anguilla anguilla TaxID=7936 RepID=A0A0E9U6S5_ANGAN
MILSHKCMYFWVIK